LSESLVMQCMADDMLFTWLLAFCDWACISICLENQLQMQCVVEFSYSRTPFYDSCTLNREKSGMGVVSNSDRKLLLWLEKCIHSECSPNDIFLQCIVYLHICSYFIGQNIKIK